MSNVNLITSLESKLTTIPDEKTCMKLLKEYITTDLYKNHLDLLSENGLHFHDLNELDRSVSLLFKQTYVDENWHGTGNKTLHDIFRTQLPVHHQGMLILGNVYRYSRKLKIFG